MYISQSDEGQTNEKTRQLIYKRAEAINMWVGIQIKRCNSSHELPLQGTNAKEGNQGVAESEKGSVDV